MNMCRGDTSLLCMYTINSSIEIEFCIRIPFGESNQMECSEERRMNGKKTLRRIGVRVGGTVGK